jgi:hypothetical protein
LPMLRAIAAIFWSKGHSFSAGNAVRSRCMFRSREALNYAVNQFGQDWNADADAVAPGDPVASTFVDPPAPVDERLRGRVRVTTAPPQSAP